MTFIRTVLGDIDPADLGATYCHEHLAIAGGKPVELYPDFRLDDVRKAVEELEDAIALGLRSVVDAMPADAGRDVLALAEISRRAGIHLVAPTGLHHARYYDDRHWGNRLSATEIGELFVADITTGIDALDYGGPVVRRTPHRAGIVKIAGSRGGASERDARIFEAAAIAHRATGCPILTHCEDGTGGVEQIALLQDHGVEPRHVILSHVDKVADRGYHREIFATGAAAEWDQGFRWGDAANGTLDLVEWAVTEGFERQIVFGHDAARRGYWRTYGGEPGLGFLLGPFSDEIRRRGVPDSVLRACFVENPARVLAFEERTA
ncbi:MAG: phosphotriesterase [Chloroflexota bacterium]